MRSAAGTLLLLALAGCVPASSYRMNKLFGGEDNVDIVASPERVEAFRLRPPTPGDSPEHYNEWPIVGDPVRVPSSVAARLSRGLTSPSTYPQWEEPKTCEPRPGFMVRFTADSRHIDVVFCFDCNILFTYRGAESVWYANFDESTKPIASLLLEVFPRDPVLGRLAGKGSP